MSTLATTLILVVFPALMLAAAVFDLLSYRIPNWISLALVAAFALAAPMAGMGLWTAAGHGGAMLLVLGVGMGLFAMGWAGAGDVKLAAAAALWFGPGDAFFYILLASVLGGVLSVAILVLRNTPLPAAIADNGWVMRLRGAERPVPYALALAPAGLICLSQSVWMPFLVSGAAIG